MNLHLPVDELIPTLRREVLVLKEMLCTIKVIIRAILVFLRDSVVELIL